MPDDPIIQNLISRLGQSQDERLAPQLGVHYADIDERTPAELLAYARRLAAIVPFTPVGVAPVPDPKWQPFFQPQPLPNGETKAPLALFATFLELYQFPRGAINRLTGRHMDFFYKDVLRFAPRAATPDRAHVVLSLKKGSSPIRILPSHIFSAGKGPSGAELLYSPTIESIVNTARVESLRSIFVDHAARGQVRFAPAANSSDGLGGPLPEEAPKWRPFGSPDLPAADVGFAIASPILRMKEGRRVITVSLAVSHAGTLTADVSDAFQAFLTSEKHWLGPYPATATIAGGRLEFRLELPDGEPAVVDYSAAVHAHAYTTDAPILQLLLKPGHHLGYDELSRVRLETARITVDVEGVKTLALESDAGTLDPKKAFLPFGPQPVAGSRFLIGCDEALGKTLSRLDVTLEWKGAPNDFSTQYVGYTAGFIIRNSAFTASALFRDRASEHTRSSEALFHSTDGTQPAVLRLIGTASQAAPHQSDGEYVYAASRAHTAWGRRAARRMVLRRPVSGSFLVNAPEPRRGSVVLTLGRSFLHAEYRQQSVERVIARVADKTTALLKEPYTPTVQSISLAYTAHTADVRVSSTSADDFAQLDVQFFLVGPFGQMRDHGHQRAELGFVSETQVPLVPSYDGDGELLIGVGGLHAGDSISVLFQVAEGSANPDEPSERPDWFVLCDNYWKKLSTAEVVRDTTNRLLASGIVTFVIPRDATTDNTILPAGPVWLKATIDRDPLATSQLIDVVANAVELQFVMDSEDAAADHLASAQPKGSIARLKTPIPAVKKIAQPFASFGGRPRERDLDLRARAAERLRHKNRGITPWDYERLVLDAFPSVNRVKCIPHAKPGSWMAPGHVLIAVVPDLRNRNAPNPLQPKVDADTLLRIADYVNAHVSGHADVTVRNPTYQRVHVACRVRLRTGYEFNFYSQELRRALVRALSPWAFDDDRRRIGFGGRVYRSVLLDVVEKLPYVDYVTDFKLSTFVGSPSDGTDTDHVEAATPDAILVSDSTHDVAEAV